MNKYAELMREAAEIINSMAGTTKRGRVLRDLRETAAEMEQQEPVLELREGQIAWSKLTSDYTGFLYWAPVAPAVPEAYRDLLQRMVDELVIIDESEGVAGFHLNGDVSAWDEGELPTLRDEATKLLSASPEPATRQESGTVRLKLREGEPLEPSDLGDYDADGGEMRLTVSYLSSFLNEINKSEGGDRDELLEYHLERALQWLDAAMKEEQ